MITDVFFLMTCVAVVFTLYAFLVNDRANYTHVLAGLVAAIIFVLCGFEMLGGVQHYLADASVVTVDSGWVGMFLIAFGAIMVLYVVVRTWSHAQDVIADLEEAY